MMITEMRLGDIEVEVVRKDIKNVHLSVNPPTGKVRISAPESMNLDLVRAYALTKLAWIREQQARIRNQERELPKEFVSAKATMCGASVTCSRFWSQRSLKRLSEPTLCWLCGFAPVPVRRRFGSSWTSGIGACSGRLPSLLSRNGRASLA